MAQIECLEHLCKAGERWDTLAWHYYGNPFDYGRIIESNPAFNIDDVLPSGTVILIPLKTIEEQLNDEVTSINSDLPPWKR